jgi:hypothetical protein
VTISGEREKGEVQEVLTKHQIMRIYKAEVDVSVGEET